MKTPVLAKPCVCRSTSAQCYLLTYFIKQRFISTNQVFRCFIVGTRPSVFYKTLPFLCAMNKQMYMNWNSFCSVYMNCEVFAFLLF